MFKRILVAVLSILLMEVHLFALDPIVVSQDGKGDFKTIQEAINSLSSDAKTQRVILIKKGNYKEKIFIDKNFITLKGENPATTVVAISLARDDWRCSNPDDYGTAAINLKGNDITLENLSFINSYGKDVKAERIIPCANDSTGFKTVRPTTHQMALRSFSTTRLIVINCIFRAWGGDTVSPWNTDEGMFYFKDCIMEGGVDFYCPRGWALADNCTFVCQSSPAGIWHDGSKNVSSKTVLLNCKFAGDKDFKLGRYHRDAQFYLLNCNFDKNMADADIYLVPTSNTILWGRRIYYYNCHRTGGDFAWHQNNLPADFGINEFNVPWVYDYKWNPAAKTTIPVIETAAGLIAANSATDPVANNMLLYQRNNGGWPKHFREQKVDYHKALSVEELKILQSGFIEGIDATIDNGATTGEIRYLVKAFKITANNKYLEAAEKGIRYLLNAQYKNGGWPQYYPDFSSYRGQVTFNDNAMINVLNVLADVVNKKNGMEVVASSYSNQCSDAIKRGIDCILHAQVLQQGKLTVWCAQHDAKTLQPARARKYELPSLSGSESEGILRFLMSVENPSKEIKNAITAGVEWLDKVKIVGWNFTEVDAPGTPKGKDKKLLPNPTPTTWARFYDLVTNEPFFCGRDGIPKKTVAEIEYERRNGYAWYVASPAKLLAEEYPVWKERVEK